MKTKKILSCVLTVILMAAMLNIQMYANENAEAPTAPTITSPSNGQTFDSARTIDIRWSDSANALSYYIIVKNEDTSTNIIERTVNSAGYTIDANVLKAGQNYKIAVRANGQDGTETWATNNIYFVTVQPINKIKPGVLNTYRATIENA